MSYQDERHIVSCWANALFDMAENLGPDASREYVVETALIAKAEQTSTCICHEDDEWYDAHPEHPRPEKVAIAVAAVYYGFAEGEDS